MVKALFVAAGIGEVLAVSASIAGAEGGCQAEIGSASAMAAGALSYLEGGGAEEITHAAALALKSMLGLTCDPVAGACGGSLHKKKCGWRCQCRISISYGGGRLKKRHTAG